MKTLVAYMPALHAGYIQLIDKVKPDNIYLFDNKFAAGLVPQLGRDIRALAANDAVNMVKALYPKTEMDVLDQGKLAMLKKIGQVYMPNEDISVEFAKKYLAGTSVKYINIFLRWDMKAVDKSLNLNFDHQTSKSSVDRKFMKASVELSKNSPDWWRQIGALLVKDGRILLRAYNQPYPNKNYSIEVFGDPKSNFGPGEKIELSRFIHAEALLISDAARQGITTGDCSLYVTTFPCPVCAKLVANAGIKKIFYKEGYSVLDAEEIFKNKKIKLIKVI